MIVDDDAPLRRMLAAMFETAGYEVAASNGREALGYASTLEADIVVTDMLTPEVEGWKLIPELLEMNSELKIIAMSQELGAEKNLTLAKAAGAIATLTKPLTTEKLQRMLHEISHLAMAD
ncbi:MAG: response regulator [Acidobacteriaceae bacterium]|nr:response regulator [Acidobacteriaceae bacterium]